MYTKVCNDSLNITIVMGFQRSYISLYFSMGHTVDGINIKIWVYAFFMLNVAKVTIVTKLGTLIENMSITGLYDCTAIFLDFVDDFMRNSNFGIGVLHVRSFTC